MMMRIWDKGRCIFGFVRFAVHPPAAVAQQASEAREGQEERHDRAARRAVGAQQAEERARQSEQGQQQEGEVAYLFFCHGAQDYSEPFTARMKMSFIEGITSLKERISTASLSAASTPRTPSFRSMRMRAVR